MADRSLDQLTLSEKFIDAERMARELIDHLDRNFLPRTRELQKLVNTGEDSELEMVEDIAVRNRAARVLESERFSDGLFQKLDQYCRSIEQDVSRILTGS